MNVGMYASRGMHVYVCVFCVCMYVMMYVDVWMCRCVCTYVCMCVCMYVCMYGSFTSLHLLFPASQIDVVQSS